MPLPKKILCATDGTDHSAIAVAYAAELAAATGAELTICAINVVRGGGRSPSMKHFAEDEVERLLSDAAAAAVALGLKRANTATINAREAATGIVAYAEENGIDHIVTGTGDKHGLSRLVLGSVAADVAGRAHCAVTIAR